MNYINDGAKREHSITLTEREKIELTGIDDVESFTDLSVVATCPLGAIAIDGEELKIVEFGAENGILTVSGHIDSVFYSEKGSLFRKAMTWKLPYRNSSRHAPSCLPSDLPTA